MVQSRGADADTDSVSTSPKTCVPPLRLRYWSDRDDIWDIGYSTDPDEVDPPTIAFLTTRDEHVDFVGDIEDPTDPGYGCYPPEDAATLKVVDFVMRAAAHWQRVNPTMRRFTQTEIEAAVFLGAMHGAEQGLRLLAEVRPRHCRYIVEQAPSYVP